MADTGFLFRGSTTGSRARTGHSTAWSDPGNITADDGSDATWVDDDAVDGCLGLAGSNFDFSGIAGGSTIDGIEIQIGDYQVDFPFSDFDDVKLILADDSDGSENKALEITTPTGTPNTDEAGGASDLWSETIGLSDVQDVDWGFFVAGIEIGSADVWKIDFMKMKVYYTEGGAPFFQSDWQNSSLLLIQQPLQLSSFPSLIPPTPGDEIPISARLDQLIRF